MLTLGLVAAVLQAPISTGAALERVIDSVSTDTRTLAAGALFVALRGERFVGHAHLQAAFEAGACAALIEAASTCAPVTGSLPLIRVSDTRAALGSLAAFWRASFDLPVIVVAGSNGKTTTKDMVASILRASFGDDSVLATAGNLNNDIGLPLSIFGLRSHHRAAVLEIGMNHPGETARLAGIARPGIALITNAQREHQEFMQDVDAVAAEHAALIDALAASGAAVINADDPYASLWMRHAAGRKVLRFGFADDADVRATWQLRPASSDIAIMMPGAQGVSANLAIPGLHNVRNALAATAAAVLAGCAPEAIARGLERFRPARGRLQVHAGEGDTCLLDDTYNANPDSVRAAIDVLAAGGGSSMLVLGDMGEVGDQAVAFHREVGDYARTRGIARLFTIGAATAQSSAAFGAGATHFDDMAALTAAVRGQLVPGMTVLVKGSRFMRMERVIEALAKHAAPAGHCSTEFAE